MQLSLCKAISGNAFLTANILFYTTGVLYYSIKMGDNKTSAESEKEMFTNWCQSTLCLEKTKTAFRDTVIQNWKQLLEDYNDDTMRQFLEDLNYAVQNQKTKSWETTCGHTECGEIWIKLQEKERKPGCLVLNSDLRDHIHRILAEAKDELSKQKYIWCLANMFMQPKEGIKGIVTDGPENTDASLFFKMMNDCELFRFDGCDELYENILAVRKEIHHSATHLFKKGQTLNCLDIMTSLLESFPADESCRSAITQIKRMKDRTMIMASVFETEFKGIAKSAFELQNKSLAADIEINKDKGYATDELEQKLKDPQEAMKNLDGQSLRYGLKCRKELKKENQELRGKVKEMEEIKGTMDALRKRTSELKTKLRQIEDTNTSNTNIGDLLVKRVQRMTESEAKNCIIDIAAALKKYDMP